MTAASAQPSGARAGESGREQGDAAQAELRAIVLPIALLGVLALGSAVGLWVVYGERIYIDRLLTGIANCF